MSLRTLARHRVGRIFHLLRPNKHKENSKRGARRAKRRGYRSIDWDLQITKDGVIVVCHDGQPLHWGFIDPLGRIHRDAQIRDLTWAQVSRLVHPVGLYRIHRIEPMLKYAHKIGVVVVLEPKNDHRFGLDWVWQYIAEVAEQYGTVVSVRALRELHGAAHVAAARRAGFQAWEIR